MTTKMNNEFQGDPLINLLWKGELGWCICTKNKGFDIEDNVKSMKENYEFGPSFAIQNPKTKIIAPNANP